MRSAYSPALLPLLLVTSMAIGTTPGRAAERDFCSDLKRELKNQVFTARVPLYDTEVSPKGVEVERDEDEIPAGALVRIVDVDCEKGMIQVGVKPQDARGDDARIEFLFHKFERSKPQNRAVFDELRTCVLASRSEMEAPLSSRCRAPSDRASMIITEDTESLTARCGVVPIATEDVLVLDVEPYTDPDEREEFIASYVRNLEIKSERPEVIRTKLRSSTKSRLSVMKRAQSDAAANGCNVVIVLEAWEGDTSAWGVGVWGGGGVAQEMHYAHARVVVGTGDI